LSSGLNTEGKGQALYISGVPGIGKTACFMEVIGKLKKEWGKDSFNFIYVNAMNLS
jgi:origin recognition complex subunit 1